MIKNVPSRFGELTSHGRITRDEFMKILKVGKTKFYELCKKPEFPKAVRYGRSVRWVYQEVLEYLIRQEAVRD